MFFIIKDLKLRNPYLSLAMEEAILETMFSKNFFDVGLRFWRSKTAIVLGRTCNYKLNLKKFQDYEITLGHKIYKNKNIAEIKDEQKKISSSLTPIAPPIPLLRRLSGGGTVVLSPHILNYSIYMNLKTYPNFYNIKYSYEVLLGVVCKALEQQGFDSSILGHSDLALKKKGEHEKKISGNAQFRKKQILVLHGTLILSPEAIPLIEENLSHPPKEPNYRNHRPHTSFLCALDKNFDTDIFCENLKTQLQKLLQLHVKNISPEDMKRIRSGARSLALNFYKKPLWTLEAKIE